VALAPCHRLHDLSMRAGVKSGPTPQPPPLAPQLPLSSALSSPRWNNRAPLPPLLRRARARSPPHCRPQKRVHSSALKPATSSSTLSSQSRFGRVTFSFSTATVPRRSSSARWLSVARGLWASLSPACRCVRVEVEWGCSSRVRVGTLGSPAARFRHHRTGGPPCPMASTLSWLCRPVLATNRLSSMTWSCSSAQLRRSAHRRRAPATAAPPLRLSLSDRWGHLISRTRARAGAVAGRARERATPRVLGRVCFRAGPVAGLDLVFVFLFIFFSQF
jgi:hypothetical protein